MRPPVPGLDAFRSGRIGAGVCRAGLFAALLLLAWARRGRIADAFRSGDPARLTAVAFLLLAAAALVALEWGAAAGRFSMARRFRRNRLAVLGLAAMLLLYLAALLTPLLAPDDPNRQEIEKGMYLAPSAEHLLGTDRYGRDVLSRILYGSRISLSIGFIAVGISVTIGTLVGALAGYFRGITDKVLMRLVDVLLSFPRLILLLAVIALFHPSIFLLVAVLGLTGWMGTARIVRGEVLSLREREFVLAARALGFRAPRIIFVHILPNVLAPIVVAATLSIANTVMIEASLSFLGLGVQPPAASWGTMINDGRNALTHAWWIATFPGLAILLTVTSFNLVGDGLRDLFDRRRGPREGRGN